MFRNVVAASVAAFVFCGPAWAADERPMDHIGMVISEIQSDLTKEELRTNSTVKKTMHIEYKACQPESNDGKQSVYFCQIRFNVAEEGNTYSLRTATFKLKHDLAADTWTSE